jgi:transposase-like protein
MEKRSYRRFTAEEKRTILEETRQPGVTMAEVCRKHSVSPALIYQWGGSGERWRSRRRRRPCSRWTVAARVSPTLRRHDFWPSLRGCAAWWPRSRRRIWS